MASGSPVEPAAQTKASTLKPWPIGARRTGLVVRKMGMTALWLNDVRTPVTVLRLEDTEVVGHRRPPSDGHYAVQVGCSNRYSSRRLRRSEARWAEKNGVFPKRAVYEFAVDGAEAMPAVGTVLSAAHFVPGQYVDVRGVS